jgi:hypothetical protein
VRILTAGSLLWTEEENTGFYKEKEFLEKMSIDEFLNHSVPWDY